MSPRAISARIREASRLSDLRMEHHAEGKVDYSPAAISARIREVEELRRLCTTLGRATPA